MGSSEKFCLKWNDFQKNVSKSFSQLRQQIGLFDVTLVSSDQKPVSAHRLVLSACSEFFKTIFYSNTHSHPLLYLDGVDSREINLMLDYIYQGEVQIYQECLDRFLEIANKFKLDGLLATEDEDTGETKKFDNAATSEAEDVVWKEEEDLTPPKVSSKPKAQQNVQERSLKVPTNEVLEANNSEVNEKFLELVVQEPDRTFRCTVCHKTMSHRGNMKRHVETHLTGLSYDCPTCEKTFRSSNALTQHKSREHRDMC